MQEMKKLAPLLGEYLPFAKPVFQTPGLAFHITVSFTSGRLSLSIWLLILLKGNDAYAN